MPLGLGFGIYRGLGFRLQGLRGCQADEKGHYKGYWSYWTGRVAIMVSGFFRDFRC